jgi:hypothetical protein
MRKIMTDKKDTNDFDSLDELFSNDFDFGDEVAAKDEPPIAVVPETNDFDFDFDDDDFGIGQPDKQALTPKELDYIKRGVFSKGFMLEMRAQKKQKDDQRLKELEPIVNFVRNYHEKIDQIDWYEDVILKDFLDSYPDGSKKLGDIIYRLASDIQSIALSAAENNHDHKIHGDDMMNIKMLAIFIMDLAEGRL